MPAYVSYKNAKSLLKPRDLLNLLTKYIPKIPPREISCGTSFRVRCDQKLERGWGEGNHCYGARKELIRSWGNPLFHFS